MGFVNVAAGIRAVGYVERERLPSGPVAFITHSGSVFSAMLRTRRHLGFTVVVSSRTGAGDHHRLLPRLRPRRWRGPGWSACCSRRCASRTGCGPALARAAEQGVAVVALTVGGSTTGRALVAAHSGALAGSGRRLGGTVRRLRGDPGGRPRRDGRHPRAVGRTAGGTSGAGGSPRSTTPVPSGRWWRTWPESVGVPFATIGASTRARLAALLDPGLVPANPLDVWGTGADTEGLFAGCLRAMADDEDVSAVALAVDLVEEYDGDESYPDAVIGAAALTDKPVVVLSNLGSAIDQAAAARVRAAGVPVLEGTRSGLSALGHLLEHRDRRTPGAPTPSTADRRVPPAAVAVATGGRTAERVPMPSPS